MVEARAPMILVVDDDHEEAEELVRSLTARGFAAVSAASVHEARAVVNAVQVDAILGHLARRDGSLFTLLASLAARPAIVLGYADVAIEPPPELDAICVRPLDLAAVAAFLHRRLGRRHSGELPRVAAKESIPPARRRASGEIVLSLVDPVAKKRRSR